MDGRAAARARADRGGVFGRGRSGGVGQRAGMPGELLQRLRLEGARALAADREDASDLLERPRRAAAEPEAHLDDAALAVVELRQDASERLTVQRMDDLLVGTAVRIGEQVAVLGAVRVVADRGVDRDDRRVGPVAQGRDFGELEAGGVRQFGVGGGRGRGR